MNVLDNTIVLDRSNIAEWPNPKPLTTKRVYVRMNHSENSEEQTGEFGTGFIRNAKLHPKTLTKPVV